MTAVELPENWAEAVDPETGDTYYFNIETNETSWDPPGDDTPAADEEEEDGEGGWAEAVDPETGEIYYVSVQKNNIISKNALNDRL